VDAADLVVALEVGERARDAQDAVIAARRQAHGVGGLAQQGEAGLLGPGDLLEQLAVGLGIGAQMRQAEGGEAALLAGAGGGDTGGDLGAALAGAGR
jgi:hypothetical protein